MNINCKYYEEYKHKEHCPFSFNCNNDKCYIALNESNEILNEIVKTNMTSNDTVDEIEREYREEKWGLEQQINDLEERQSVFISMIATLLKDKFQYISDVESFLYNYDMSTYTHIEITEAVKSLMEEQEK